VHCSCWSRGKIKCWMTPTGSTIKIITEKAQKACGHGPPSWHVRDLKGSYTTTGKGKFFIYLDMISAGDCKDRCVGSIWNINTANTKVHHWTLSQDNIRHIRLSRRTNHTRLISYFHLLSGLESNLKTTGKETRDQPRTQ